jgi:unsaturated rhamnogalacturonyl hydrolase
MKASSLIAILLPGVLLAASGPREWTPVADHLAGTPVESYAFNWGEGVQMMGLMKIAAIERSERYTDYVERWARFYEAKSLPELLNIGPNAAQPKRAGYCGHWSPAMAILDLYRVRPDPAHLRLAKGVADFIREGAERSPEGGLGHWQGSHQLWDDTLFMACPVLSRLGQMEKQPQRIDDSARQLILYARHLQDQRTGLFFHMWDWQTDTRSEGFWGRGNGWVLMSLADTLEVLKKSDPQYGQLKSIAEELVKGLGPLQDTNGVWHTVLDDPKSYAESSASAMFCYGLLKLARLHVLPASARAPALRAWKAINEHYVKDGVVTGVSAGTSPAGVGNYLKVKVGSETWGTGAYLLAASEIARTRK